MFTVIATLFITFSLLVFFIGAFGNVIFQEGNPIPVILLERPEIEPHYEKVKNIFAGYSLHIVEVFCPLEICRQRNIERGDRTEDLSDWQSKIMAKDIPYNYTVNTHLNSPEECADSILKGLFCKSEV
ncbi:hypothetical protein KHA97_03590 [Bacillus sp. FJAT-49870]|uniref:Uncharacterized protein n=2 Tax=Lederbergia citri TaxID=2833580 RepID=A0A942YF64_9BACI|nr:hypothetical protein [Lederbergia citri]